MTRKEVYAYIKENNLQEIIKQDTGKNYTNVPTEDLVYYVWNHDEKEEPSETEDTLGYKNVLKTVVRFLYEVDKSLFEGLI